MGGRFKIDFFELCFLTEACIPPSPIARNQFFLEVIDKHYYIMTPEERKHLYNWIIDTQNFKWNKDHEDNKVFVARFNPDNQYIVRTKTGSEHKCFLYDGLYRVKKGTYINNEFIKETKKVSNE